MLRGLQRGDLALAHGLVEGVHGADRQQGLHRGQPTRGVRLRG